jgi:hypothetical protein
MAGHGVTKTLASYCATAASEPLSPDIRDRLKQHLLDFDDRSVDDLVAAVQTVSVDDPHAR